MSWAKRHADSFVVTLVVVIAFVCRAILLYHNHFIWSSGVEYVNMTRSFYDGSYSSTNFLQHPLYSILIFLANFVVGDFIRAGGWVSVIAGSVLPVPAYLLMRRFVSIPMTLTGAGLLAIHPWLLRFSTETLSESTFIFFFICGLALLAKAWDRMKPLDFVLTGAISGLAYLTRPEGVIIVLVGTWLITLNILKQRRLVRSMIVSEILLVLGFLLISGLYIIPVSVRSGKLVISRKTKMNLLKGFSELYPLWDKDKHKGIARMGFVFLGELNDQEVFQEDQEEGTFAIVMPLSKMLKLQPQKAIRIKVKEVGRFLSFGCKVMTWPFVLALLFTFPAVVAGKHNDRSERLVILVLSVAVTYFATIIAFFTHFRFLLPLTAVLMLLAGPAICWTIKISYLRSTRLGGVIACFWAFFILINSAIILCKPLRADKIGYKEAAVWLSEHTTQETLIVCPQPHIEVYAHRKVVLPYKSLTKTVALMIEKSTQFLVISDKVKFEIMSKEEQDFTSMGLVSRACFNGIAYGQSHPVTVYELLPHK